MSIDFTPRVASTPEETSTIGASVTRKLDPVIAHPFKVGFAESMSTVFLVAAAVSLLAFAIVWFMPQSMIADVCDEEELETGRRREGSFFGLFYLGRQLAVGVSSLLAGVLLDAWLGEPRRWHPLVGFGRYAAWLEQQLLDAVLRDVLRESEHILGEDVFRHDIEFF